MSESTICPLKKTYTKKDGTVITYKYTMTYERKYRPPSKKIIDEIRQKRKDGMTIKQICEEYKISKGTYYNYMKLYEE